MSLTPTTISGWHRWRLNPVITARRRSISLKQRKAAGALSTPGRKIGTGANSSKNAESVVEYSRERPGWISALSVSKTASRAAGDSSRQPRRVISATSQLARPADTIRKSTRRGSPRPWRLTTDSTTFHFEKEAIEKNLPQGRIQYRGRGPRRIKRVWTSSGSPAVLPLPLS